MKVAARINQDHIGTVVNLIVTVIAGNFSKRGIEPSSDAQHLGEITGQACEVRIEIGDVTR